jgi:hypothetical protein
MGLPWVRLDTSFPQNPKVLMLVEDGKWRSIAAYIGGLAYSGQHGTAGFLPRSCLPYVHGTTRIADELVDVGLWIPCPGGWDVNGWAEFQPAGDEAEKRRSKAKHAAEVRWHGSKAASRRRDSDA